MTVVRRVDAWLFAPGPAERLVAVQLGLAVLVGLRVALGPYPALAGQPPALFRPLSFLRVLDGMPPLGVILAVQVVGVVAAALAVAGAGRGRRGAFAVAWASLLFLAGLRTSLGKILHNDVVLLLAAVPFLAAPADARPGAGRSARFGWPVRTALVVVAGAYFFAGLAKMRNSGLAWVTSDNLRFVMYEAAGSGRAFTDRLAAAVAGVPWLATLAAAAILTLELTFPVVLWVRRARPLYAGAAVALHVLTWVTLGIDYWLWAAVVLLVLPDWSPLLLRGTSSRLAAPVAR